MNSIKELIFLIEKRPVMYLSKNYISCLKSYLDGWCYRELLSIPDLYIMDVFQEWIMNKYNLRSRNWCDIILYHSQDESDALKNFFILFKEFMNELK